VAVTDLLTETRIRRAKPKADAYKLRDGGGLYLLITPGDARQWRLRYRAGGRESMVSLGTYPATSLKAARAKRAELVKQPFAPKTLKKAVWTFEDLLFPYIGSWPVSTLTAPELLDVFRRLERRGKHETAHRAKQRVAQVLRYSIATGRAERDPTADLRGALAPSRLRTERQSRILERLRSSFERLTVGINSTASARTPWQVVDALGR
jgi:hypothetical protein